VFQRENNRLFVATVILVPDGDLLSVAVPAMPGCFSQGRTRDEALANVAIAIQGWLETERESGRGPIPETPGLISTAVTQSLEIIDAMRLAGDVPVAAGYQLEVVPVPLLQPSAA
jgi:predicted RNase H-like HicB family nuclease